MTTITLEPDERILSIEAETANGPGWSNRILWVHVIQAHTDKVRTQGLHESEWTVPQRALFDVLEAAQKAMRATVREVRG